MSIVCAICISNAQNPVSLPCGHAYCGECLNDHTNGPHNQGFRSTCPDCRAPFNLVTPNLAHLPPKYHDFIKPDVRRLFLVDADGYDRSEAEELEQRLAASEARCEARNQSVQRLTSKCERLQDAINAHRQGERDAKLKADALEVEVAKLKKLATQLKIKSNEYKKQRDGYALNLKEAQDLIANQTRFFVPLKKSRSPSVAGWDDAHPPVFVKKEHQSPLSLSASSRPAESSRMALNAEAGPSTQRVIKPIPKRRKSSFVQRDNDSEFLQPFYVDIEARKKPRHSK